jgi:hypothetical protein
MLLSQQVGCGSLVLESVRSPDQWSIAHLPRGTGIEQRSLHRVPVAPILSRSEGWAAIVPNSLRILREGQDSVIPARHRFDQWLFREALAEHKCGDVSQWREIRECMATESPTGHDPQPTQQCAHRRHHARKSLPGVHKRGGCCREQSSSSPFITHFTNLVPGGSSKMRP